MGKVTRIKMFRPTNGVPATVETRAAKVFSVISMPGN